MFVGGGMNFIDSVAENGNGFSAVFQSGLVCNGINAECQPADDGEPVGYQAARKIEGIDLAVKGVGAGADHSDSGSIEEVEIAASVKLLWTTVDNSELFREIFSLD